MPNTTQLREITLKLVRMTGKMYGVVLWKDKFANWQKCTITHDEYQKLENKRPSKPPNFSGSVKEWGALWDSGIEFAKALCRPMLDVGREPMKGDLVKLDEHTYVVCLGDIDTEDYITFTKDDFTGSENAMTWKRSVNGVSVVNGKLRIK